MKPNDEPKWWFPKKEFGWGWGLPSKWQGWAALLAFPVLLLVFGPLASAVIGNLASILLSIGLTVAFLALVVVKGEPLRGDTEGRQERRRNPATLLRRYRIAASCVSALLILLSIPLALKWVPKNLVYGFRTPGSLAGSSSHWFYVNEVAGVAGMAAGIAGLSFTWLVVDRLKLSDIAKGRAVLIATVVLIVAAMIPPILVS